MRKAAKGEVERVGWVTVGEIEMTMRRRRSMVGRDYEESGGGMLMLVGAARVGGCRDLKESGDTCIGSTGKIS